MTTINHISDLSFTDLEGRTTPHSHFIAHDLDATRIINFTDGSTFAVLPGGHHMTITTYDAIGLNIGADMILKYELVNPHKFDMLPVNTTAEATEILRKVISRNI